MSKNSKNKKMQIMVDEAFEEHIEILKRSLPGFGTSLIIRLAIKAVAEAGFEFGFAPIKVKTQKAMDIRKATAPKEDWCKMFGGELNDGICDITKYEVLPSGHVQKSARSIAVTAFPPDRDDFKRQVIGHFESVEAAEEAYKNKPLH